MDNVNRIKKETERKERSQSASSFERITKLVRSPDRAGNPKESQHQWQYCVGPIR